MPAPSLPPLPADALDPADFQALIARSTTPIPLFRAALTQGSQWLDQAFCQGAPIRPLIHQRATLVDTLLAAAWQRLQLPVDAGVALVAVGGYGRGELHPHSDIDILILLEDGCEPDGKIEGFLTLLWDINLKIGSSVRTVSQCVEEAERDLTVLTSLMESRVIIGPSTPHADMQERISPQHLWPSQEFFRAKVHEQRERHAKYNNTEYNLEPNIKGSPGGLRDIQTITWIACRHFGAGTVEEMLSHHLLTENEYQILVDAQDFLWRVRYGLHMLAKRAEDRLLFDHQRALAKMFGYEDDAQSLAVEKFMQFYYRCAIALAELNELLLQHFDEEIVRACEPEHILALNARFRVRNGDIEAINDRIFRRYPWAMMEMFVLLAQNDHIRGVRAATIRLMREHRHLINDRFRQDSRNTSLFMELLRSPRRVFTQLKRMKRYGMLGRYLPEFGRVVGQMQHDLFHIYTVDAHTLLVVKNMHRFTREKAEARFPLAVEVVRRLPKRELLYIAGLYHDIAKGRGGDHSTLGATDAAQFCQRHRLGKWDTNLVCWLVEHHLLMSSVAQKKDLSDPQVIHDFAQQVGDTVRLDYLYALTVADINATNPNLWNAWKDSLLRQLYHETRRALRHGLENQVDKQVWIDDTRKDALKLLRERGIDARRAKSIWSNSGDDYFLRESPEDIAWHTEAIAHNPGEDPLVLIKPRATGTEESATQIFVRTKDRDNVFAAAANALDSLSLNIHDARIYSSVEGYAIDTFFVLNEHGKPLGDDPALLSHIRDTLHDALQPQELRPELIQRRTPRQLKHFTQATVTSLDNDASQGYTLLEVMTSDRPGLLARLGRIFVEFGIRLHNAKIATLGERVEDMFLITTRDGQPLTDPAMMQQFQQSIREQLDQQVAP